jgi:hypothetical protein
MYIGSFNIDDVLTFSVNTADPSTGNPADADSLPTYKVYEDATDTPLLSGSMAKLDDSNTVGFYSKQITLTSLSGFEQGKNYTIRIEGTVNGTSGVTSKEFQIGAKVEVIEDSSTPSTPETSETELTVEQLLAAAGQSSEIDINGQRVKRRSIDELIKLNGYLSKKAVSNGWGSVAMAKAIPPSANGETGENDRLFNRV